jgi:pre-mRNA-processing factor 39
MDAKGRKMEHYGAFPPAHPDRTSLMFDPSDPRTDQSDYETKVEMHYSALCEVHRQNRLKEIVTTYEANLKEFNKRRLFEAGIKRTFFHAKSLDEQQLEVWRKYLEFEENEGNYEKTVLLYERAVVPLCYYAEFWERYAAFIHKSHGDQPARGIFQRAIQKFLKNRPDLYLAQGHFEETLGNLDVARKFYIQVYEDIAPGLFDGIFRHLNLERRAGNLEIVESLYQKALKFAKMSDQDTLTVFVSQHLANFHIFIKNDPSSAIKIYEEALCSITSRKSLYLSYIESLQFEETSSRLTKIKETYEKSISESSEVIFIYE